MILGAAVVEGPRDLGGNEVVDVFDKAAQKRNLSLRLYRRSLRSGKLLAMLGVFVLAISPLSWAGFAVNSFLSNADLLTKVVRLQGVVLTQEFSADFRSAAVECEGRSHVGPALKQFHLNQFSFVPQPVLLALLTIDALEVPVANYAQLFYGSMPARLDSQNWSC
jgi:hypothetical protein